MKAAVLFTGGKDSCLALYKAKKQGYKIKYLLSLIPASPDAWMWHKPNLQLLRAQASQLGIPLLIKRTKKLKDEKLADLRYLLNRIKNKVNYLIIGGIASSYQAQRIKAAAKQAGLKLLAPLWQLSAEQLWKQLLKNKFKVILTKIACEGIPKEFLGKPINESELSQLKKLGSKYHFNLSFEGGEAETAVLGCPLFKKGISIESEIKSESAYRHFLVIRKIK